MRPYLIFLFVVFLNLFSGAKTCFAQTGWQWGLTNTHGLVESWNVVADRYSNSIVAGYYTNADTVNFGGFYISNSGPSTSMFIAKSDSSGNYQWVVNTQNNNFDEIDPIKMVTDTEGNIYLYGSYAIEPFDTIATFSIGSFFLSYHVSPATPGLARSSYFLVKFSPVGTVLFAKNICSGLGYDLGGMGMDDLGNIYLAGLISTSISGYTVIGGDTIFSSANHNVFIAKYNSSGTFIWAKNSGGNIIQSIGVTKKGSIYYKSQYSSSMILGGDTLTGSNNFLAKINALGDIIWARNIDSSTEINDICCDQYSNIYLCGGLKHPTILGPDALTWVGGISSLVIKYDSSGNISWAKASIGSSYDQAYGIASDKFGNVWICGWMSGGNVFPGYSMNFSGHVLNQIPGSFDPLYIAEYDDCGRFIIAEALKSGGDDPMGISVDNISSVYLGGDYASPLIFGTDTFNSPLPGYEHHNLLIFAKMLPLSQLIIC